MTLETYLEYKNNPKKDMMELFYSYFSMKGRVSLSFPQFKVLFSKWIQSVHFLVVTKGRGLSFIIDNLFYKLDKHFGL